MPDQVMRMQTKATTRKVVGATAGAGLGAALATLTIWALETYSGAGDIPDGVEGAITTILTVAVAYYSGYNLRPASRDTIVVD